MAEKTKAYGEGENDKCLMAINLDATVINYNVGYTKQHARKWMEENMVEQQVIFCRINCLLSGKSSMKITDEEEQLVDMIKKSEEAKTEPVVDEPPATDEPNKDEPPKEEVTE